MAVDITVQETPNPGALRFVLDKPVQDEPRGRFFTDAGSADDALAKSLLEVDGVAGVMLLPTSVTVNKADDVAWSEVKAAVRDVLEGYFA